MSTLQAFRRVDGDVGIRNHLFALPAVVCANQVAIDVARSHSSMKYIEHQHGCAQIGADLIQTRRVFTHLALHPNVYASMFVGLGCEGIVAKDLFAGTRGQTQKTVDLTVIQESGGTLGAENAVQAWISDRERETATLKREAVEWSDIVVGLLVDDPVQANQSPLLHEAVRALWDLGARMVVPERVHHVVSQFGDVPTVIYGDSSQARVFAMSDGSTALETATGLTAAGAHVIVHLASQPHAFGSPLAPTVRWAASETTYQQFFDDFDGQLVDNLDIPRLTEQLQRVINGQPTVAEEFGMDDFALYRIGPTV